jgi:hypothetical protein
MKNTNSFGLYWFIIGAFNGGAAVGAFMSYLFNKPWVALVWLLTMVVYDIIMYAIIKFLLPKNEENV